MKIVAFNASARKDGNTATMLRTVLAELDRAGMDTELVQFGPKAIAGCIACFKCKENKDGHCAVDDSVNEYIDKMVAADGILLGSPTYFANVSTNMKSLIDRAGMVTRANGDLLRRKVGAAVVAARRGGAIHAFNSMNHFFFISQMVVPGSDYWNMGFGLGPGDVDKDQEALDTMRTLGRNMAWVLEKLHG